MKQKSISMGFARYNPKSGKFITDEYDPRKRWVVHPYMAFKSKEECTKYWEEDKLSKKCITVEVFYSWKER